jgi:hypothetical protein
MTHPIAMELLEGESRGLDRGSTGSGQAIDIALQILLALEGLRPIHRPLGPPTNIFLTPHGGLRISTARPTDLGPRSYRPAPDPRNGARRAARSPATFALGAILSRW